MLKNKKNSKISDLHVFIFLLILISLGLLLLLRFRYISSLKQKIIQFSSTNTSQKLEIPKNWKTYVSKNKKYTIDYPQSFYPVDDGSAGNNDKNSDSVLFLETKPSDYPTKDEYVARTMLEVFAYKNDTNPTVETLANRWLKDISPEILKTINQKKYLVQNYPAIEISGASDGFYKTVVTTFNANGYDYGISAGDSSGQEFPKIINELKYYHDTMVSSFRILK